MRKLLGPLFAAFLMLPAGSSAAQQSQAEATEPVAAETVAGPLVEVATIDVGKWPEGIVTVGDSAWVAVSGEKKLARLDLQANTVAADIAVGRLPVNVAVWNDQLIFAISQTDQLVWKIDQRSNRAEVLRSIGDCPQDFALSGDRLYVLIWNDCSSANASVMIIDLNSPNTTQTIQDLGPDAWQITVGEDGVIWIAQGSVGITKIDGRSLATDAVFQPNAGAQHLTVRENGIYYFSRERPDLLVKIDPDTGSEIASAPIGQNIVTLWSGNDEIRLLTGQGKFFRFSDSNDFTNGVIPFVGNHTPAKPFMPESATDHGDDGIAVTLSSGQVMTFRY